MADFNFKTFLIRYIYVPLGFFGFVCTMYLNPTRPFASGVLLILCAIALYFYVVFFTAHRNWLDIRAMFTAVWLGTIGLAALRLTGYQEQWQSLSWIYMGLAYAALQIGASLGIHFGTKWQPALCKGFGKLHLGKWHFSFRPGRLFLICVITTAIGLACFITNVAIKGFIPCFSDDPFAYTNFYTKFHIFSVAACSISGLCYYAIRTQPLRIWQKIILYICILYATFLFPIMVVSRGVFVVGAVSLTTSVFYLHKKRFLALLLCLVTILGVYWGCSYLRNFSDSQLSYLFEPVDVSLGGSSASTDPTDSTDISDSTDPSDPSSSTDDSQNGVTFQLSPKMAFLYGYLTVSHDNFNEAVQNNQAYTYGIRQLAPFNVILRSDKLEKALSDSPYYFVRPHLNTTNLIGDFYYDFGILGVVIFMLLWAFVFGLNQGIYEAGENPFLLLLLGNTMVPVVLCFFASWTSNFTHWMIWGVALLLAAASCITASPKEMEKT